jgi:hypothetical protein
MIQIKRILLFTCLASLFSCRHADTAEYTFPEDSNGWAAIVFNCENGEKQEVNEKGIQFIIPNNKILLSSFERSKGVLHDKYFIIDSNGFRKEIFEFKDTIEASDSSLYIRGKLLVNKYISEKNLDKKFSVVFLNISSQYSTSTDEKEFHEFEEKLSKYLIDNNISPK